MGVTALSTILKHFCCHGNVTYKFLLTTIRRLTIQIVLIATKNNYCSDIWFNYVFLDFIKKSVGSYLNKSHMYNRKTGNLRTFQGLANFQVLSRPGLFSNSRTFQDFQGPLKLKPWNNIFSWRTLCRQLRQCARQNFRLFLFQLRMSAGDFQCFSNIKRINCWFPRRSWHPQ